MKASIFTYSLISTLIICIIAYQWLHLLIMILLPWQHDEMEIGFILGSCDLLVCFARLQKQRRMQSTNGHRHAGSNIDKRKVHWFHYIMTNLGLVWKIPTSLFFPHDNFLHRDKIQGSIFNGIHYLFWVFFMEGKLQSHFLSML